MSTERNKWLELDNERLKARVKHLEKKMGQNLPEFFSPEELKLLFTSMCEASDSLSHSKHNNEEREAIDRLNSKIMSLPKFDDNIDIVFSEICERGGES